MENVKRKRSPLVLAYESAPKRYGQHEQTALPGPLFDATVIGLAIAFAIGSLVT
jgi:hypothetical protein